MVKEHEVCPLFWGKRPIFQIAFAVGFEEIIILSHARWAPTSYKQAYYSTYKGYIAYITPVTHSFSAIYRGGPNVTPFTTTGFWAQVWHLRHLSAQPAAGDDARCGCVAGAIFALGRLLPHYFGGKVCKLPHD